MEKRIKTAVLILFVVLFIFNVMGCSNTPGKVSTNNNLEQTIEEKLNNITNLKDSKVSASSNPYDYIMNPDTIEDYKYIAAQGEKSLNVMLNKFAGSNEDGLQEYIMAIACSEILKENIDSKKWVSGREWYDNYTKNNN
jgi:hypothetical protein